jgi:hypothetical protein
MDPVTFSPNPSEVFAELCSALPACAEDTEEAIATRARNAVDAVFALRPGNEFELSLAIQVVAMDAHAADSLRAAAQAYADPMEVHHWRAQAVLMSRLSNSALGSLLSMQAERVKRPAAEARQQRSARIRAVNIPPGAARSNETLH